MQTITETQAREAGVPEWMIERIKTRCVVCDHWKGQCNAPTMICYTKLDRSTHYGEWEFGFSIQFWLTMQRIRVGSEEKKRDVV